MKIINIKNAKNAVACMVAVELLAMQFYVPPFEREESFVLEEPSLEEDKNVSRKLEKKERNLFSNSSYSRNARNSLNKSNYYGGTRDF